MRPDPASPRTRGIVTQGTLRPANNQLPLLPTQAPESESGQLGRKSIVATEKRQQLYSAGAARPNKSIRGYAQVQTSGGYHVITTIFREQNSGKRKASIV